jgi:hypothetical protein
MGDKLDFKKMELENISSVENCYDCVCGDGCDGNGGCDCVSCDSD